MRSKQYFVTGVRRIEVSEQQLNECKEPWILIEAYKWLRKVMEKEAYSMAEGTVSDVLTDLFMYHIGGIGLAAAEDFAIQTLEWLIDQKVMSRSDDGDLNVPEEYDRGYRARLAQVKAAQLDISTAKLSSSQKQSINFVVDLRCDSWSAAIPDDVHSRVSPAVRAVQNATFELIQTEMIYIDSLRALLIDFRDVLVKSDKMGRPIVDDAVQFTNAVSHNTEEVLTLHEKYLYTPLLERQREAYVISGVGDILLEWIRLAIDPYLRHAEGLGPASEISETERRHNSRYSQFYSDFQSAHSAANVLSIMTRLLRYPLFIMRILEGIAKLGSELEIDYSAEKRYLERAHGRITQLAKAFQSRYGSSQRQYVLNDLRKAILFSGKVPKVELGLNSRTREVLNNGSVEIDSRRLPMNMILLDNYLLITKRDFISGSLRYDVAYSPIPIDLLMLVSQDDKPLTATFNRQSFATINSGATVSADELKSFANSDDSGDDRRIWPFRIKHLGRQGCVYQIFVATEGDRKQWCAAILKAISKRFSSQSKSFALEVVSDADFAYRQRHLKGSVADLYVSSPESVVDKALKAVKKTPFPSPIGKHATCSAFFYLDEIDATNVESKMINSEQYKDRKPYVMIGCKSGLFLSYGYCGSWFCVLKIDHVKQIKVLPEYGIAIILADKSLFAYSLEALFAQDTVKNRTEISQQSRLTRLLSLGQLSTDDSSGLQPIGDSRHFDWFTVGIHQQRTIIVAHERDTASDLRVFEPIAGKCPTFTAYDYSNVLEDPHERRMRIANLRNSDLYGFTAERIGQDLVREMEPILLNCACLGATIVSNMIILHTEKGFQALIYPAMTIASLPQLVTSDPVSSSQLSRQRPLGFFHVSENFYLLCYSTLCISCDAYGYISRQIVINFTGHAKAVAVIAPYVIGFDNDFIEVRLIQTGALVNIISGTDVTLIGSQTYSGEGGNIAYSNPCGLTGEDVVVRMAHPLENGRQAIFKLKRNVEATY
ncbi:CNH domain-containing protein [Kockiozyma suomiensis]|uniref:CNH domain-containing protein n=1 Tax=Kockiozyma suomiensis TaxID=1337062 RepID=UPI0033434690